MNNRLPRWKCLRNLCRVSLTPDGKVPFQMRSICHCRRTGIVGADVLLVMMELVALILKLHPAMSTI